MKTTNFNLKKKSLNCQMGLKNKYLGLVAAASFLLHPNESTYLLFVLFWIYIIFVRPCYQLASPQTTVDINNSEGDLQVTLSIKPNFSKLMKDSPFIFYKA